MRSESRTSPTSARARAGVCALVVCLAAALLSSQGCDAGGREVTRAATQAPRPPTTTAPKPPLDAFLEAEFPPADGFAPPAAAGWRVAAGFGVPREGGARWSEDWVPGSAARGDRSVRSVANGRTLFAGDYGAPWGHVVAVEHVYYENNERKTLRSVYAGLASVSARAGEIVRRGQTVGAVGESESAEPPRFHVQFQTAGELEPTLREAGTGDEAWARERVCDPSAFVAAHRSLFVPRDEEVLLLIDPDAGVMRRYAKGALKGEYHVAFGQATGRKRVRDDLKTPRGMYFVVQKSRWPVDGRSADYFGGFWLAINYPNAHDGAWGRANGLVTESQERAISAAWARREPTLRGTKLGDGIGLHGWAGEWSNDGTRGLSWGCVVLHNSDVSEIYDAIPVGSMVVLLP